MHMYQNLLKFDKQWQVGLDNDGQILLYTGWKIIKGFNNEQLGPKLGPVADAEPFDVVDRIWTLAENGHITYGYDFEEQEWRFGSNYEDGVYTFIWKSGQWYSRRPSDGVDEEISVCAMDVCEELQTLDEEYGGSMSSVEFEAEIENQFK